MTVKELKKKLEGMEDDREVRVFLIHHDFDLPIEDVTTIEGSDKVWIDANKPR